MGHPGVALRDLEASRDALSRSRYQPQPTERRLSCSHRVTFLTGANRDFPKRRQQLEPALRDFYEAPGALASNGRAERAPNLELQRPRRCLLDSHLNG